MVDLNITSPAWDVRLVSGLAGLNTIPSNGAYENPAMIVHLGSGEARRSSPGAWQIVALLSRHPELIFVPSAVANGDHLDDWRVDGVPRSVWLEFDGVVEGRAVQDVLHLIHCLGVSVAFEKRLFCFWRFPAFSFSITISFFCLHRYGKW